MQRAVLTIQKNTADKIRFQKNKKRHLVLMTADNLSVFIFVQYLVYSKEKKKCMPVKGKKIRGIHLLQIK